MTSSSDKVTVLPDGSAFSTLVLPLPKDHWIYGEKDREDEHGFEPPPMTYRLGTEHFERKEWEERLRVAGRHAIRCATMKGKEMDFDPDALIQNLIVAVLGYFTPTGLGSEDWENPPPQEGETAPE